MLGRIAQKSMKLGGSDGLSFFAFPGVSSPNLFKQLYRSRMNSVELTEEQRGQVLQEALGAFQFNIQVRSAQRQRPGVEGRQSISRGFSLSLTILQVFEDLQKMLNVTEKEPRGPAWSGPAAMLQVGGSMIQTNPLFRTVLGLCLALATVTFGLYAL